jgi:hypothetical protein
MTRTCARARTSACVRAGAGLVVVLLAWSVASCHPEGNRGGPADFFPLHDEDTWVYAIEQPLRNLHTRMTVRARGERYFTALGQRCHLVDETYGGPDAAMVQTHGETQDRQVHPIAYCRKDGFLYRALSLEYHGKDVREIGLGSSEERFLPEGLQHASAWDSLTTAYDLGGGNGYDVRQRHRAVPESRVIEVPAGRFSGCVRVDTIAVHGGRHDGQTEPDPIVLYYTDWYAPNVGLVRTFQSDRPGGETGEGPPLAQIELLAYDVEGARK